MADLKIEGMDELLNKISEMGRKASRIENDALIKAAEPILEDAVRSAPKLTGKGKEGLKITRPKLKDGKRYILIGIDRGDISEIFYMKFHEFGTSKMQARPFLGPAYEKNKTKAMEIIKEELKKAIE